MGVIVEAAVGREHPSSGNPAVFARPSPGDVTTPDGVSRLLGLWAEDAGGGVRDGFERDRRGAEGVTGNRDREVVVSADGDPAAVRNTASHRREPGAREHARRVAYADARFCTPPSAPSIRRRARLQLRQSHDRFGPPLDAKRTSALATSESRRSRRAGAGRMIAFAAPERRTHRRGHLRNATPGLVTAGCCLRTERSSDPGPTTGGAAGARHALPRGGLQLKAGARVHHRCAASVDGRDDFLSEEMPCR